MKTDGPIHALRPNMWYACGGTLLPDHPDYAPGRWELRRYNSDGVTCPGCLDELQRLRDLQTPAPQHHAVADFGDEDALFAGFEPTLPIKKPTGVPEAQLVILAEVLLKEDRYPEGVPAVGIAKGYRLDRLAEAGLIDRITLPDPDGDLDEGPRRLRVTDAGRAAVDQYDAWAAASGFSTMRGFVQRHLMGAA